jgi:hypothetical protein
MSAGVALILIVGFVIALIVHNMMRNRWRSARDVPAPTPPGSSLTPSTAQPNTQQAVGSGLTPSATKLNPQQAVIEHIRNGELDQAKMAGGDFPVIFKKGEKPIWVFNPITVHAVKTTRSFKGRSQGVSIRLMKGVSYRIGGSKGVPVDTSSVEKIDEGQMIVTTRSIYVVGFQKSQRILLSNLVAVQPYSDGVSLQTENGKTIFIGIRTTQMAQFAHELISEIADHHARQSE